ncbi:hypothetical protein M3Y96_01240800 [Aphelenchoides besseyi]|nr:hypothetical protein M3Y96_01240800 [Aphelenchoides besseyi]
MKWFTILALFAIMFLLASAAEEKKSDALAPAVGDVATNTDTPNVDREDRAARKHKHRRHRRGRKHRRHGRKHRRSHHRRHRG